MLGMIIAAVVGFVAGYGACIWFSKNNKNTHAKIRARMKEVLDQAGDEASDLKKKVEEVLDNTK